MERLTKRVGPKHVIYNGEHRHYDGGDIPVEMSTDATRDVLQRLAVYEDTGLNPEEFAGAVQCRKLTEEEKAERKLLVYLAEAMPSMVQAVVENMPKLVDAAAARALTVDAVEVVRCKDCKWWKTHECFFHAPGRCAPREENDYCSDGERRAENAK